MCSSDLGKVRYIGCSNLFGWQIVKTNSIADRLQMPRFVSAQHMYNLLRRDIEREILPACADQGMGMLCWSPLAGGMLTGKYDHAQGPAKESRVGMRREIDLPRYWNDDNFRVIESVVKAAREQDKSPAQVALSWLLGDRRVSAVVVGTRTVDQLDGSLVAGDWDLPVETRDELSQIVPLQHGYPREWIEQSWPNICGQEEFKPWDVVVDRG